jgi:hypothetical protein
MPTPVFHLIQGKGKSWMKPTMYYGINPFFFALSKGDCSREGLPFVDVRGKAQRLNMR